MSKLLFTLGQRVVNEKLGEGFISNIWPYKNCEVVVTWDKPTQWCINRYKGHSTPFSLISIDEANRALLSYSAATLCECGADKHRFTRHSPWCPKYE